MQASPLCLTLPYSDPITAFLPPNGGHPDGPCVFPRLPNEFTGLALLIFTQSIGITKGSVNNKFLGSIHPPPPNPDSGCVRWKPRLCVLFMRLPPTQVVYTSRNTGLRIPLGKTQHSNLLFLTKVISRYNQ